MKERCFGSHSPLYSTYHDTEWGVPSHDDRHLFEMLILEGAQAGLSWETVLKKREAYREAFHNFAPEKVAAMTDTELTALLQNPNLIRNRLKIFSARQNAHVYLALQQEFGTFAHYLWSYVAHTPIHNNWPDFSQIPATSPVSDALSQDLKKRGMKFVGSTIIYAYMQAVGLVNDHPRTCFLTKEQP
jgi:DNA-3-methyladenine glycosylase I